MLVGLGPDSATAMWIRLEALNMLTGPYAEEYDASLQAAYAPRDPVGEFLLGEISCRQLRVLGEGLPNTSALVRAHLGNTWTEDTHLLAMVVNEIRMLRSESVAVQTRTRARMPDLIKPPQQAGTIESEADEAQQKRQRAAFAAGPMAALFPDD